MPPITVVLADDNVIVREGVRALLGYDRGVEVVGVAGDYDELVARALATAPQVVVTDIRMPPTFVDEGIQAAKEVRKRLPGTGIVILSQFDDPEYALELLRDGSQGLAYLLKERLGRPAQLVEALYTVAEGGSTLDPKVVDSLMEAQRRRSRSKIHGLTDREYEVLALMASGRTNAGIAAKLFLSQRAVEKHSHAIFRKLGLGEDLDINQRVSAVLFFLEQQAD
jgi:DNA-binding NarL/FixJ family response regulator